MSVVDPSLGRVPRVLVPIQVDALVLRDARSGFADCRMREPEPDETGRRDLLPPPFADLEATRPKGAYLHWALPDALTRERPAAAAPATGPPPEPGLPAVPDRWLVVRFSLGATPDRRATASWVIEGGGAVPAVTPLADWTDSGELPTPGRELTVLGHGDLGWSAYYDNVVNRLGFYDALDDGAQGPIAYLVCGWYADPRLDPLGDPAVGSLSEFYARLGDLGWALPAAELEVDLLAGGPVPDAVRGGALARAASAGGRPPLVTDGSWWPRGTLLHGAVVGIGWPDVGWPAAEEGLLGAARSGPPAPEETRVAFGTTTTDALGSLMVGFLAAAQGVEEDTVLDEDRMLEAFQLGLLGEIDHPDGRARLDAGLHARAFRAESGGARSDEVTPPRSAAPPPSPAPRRPADAPGPSRVRAQAAGGRLASDLSHVATGGLETMLPARERSRVAGRRSGPEPVQRTLPRWFKANEPAVVVQGIRRSLKHGGDGRFTEDGTLMCRLSGFLVTGLSARVGEGGQSAAVNGDALLERPFDPHGVPADCVDLVGETALLDPGAARSAALQIMAVPADDTDTVDDLSFSVMVEQTVWWAMRDPLVNPGALLAPSGLEGTLPSPLAITPPAAAWAPRHLDWEVEVFPSAGGIEDWTLGELDLVPDDPTRPAAAPGSGTVISGRSLLTGGAAQAAAAAGRAAIDLGTLAGSAGVVPGDGNVFIPAFDGALVDRLARVAGDDRAGEATQTIAEALVAALRDMDILAGTLDGIHAALRGEPTGQVLGTEDPPARGPDPDAVGLVAGLLRPVRLRLVDCFGQVVDLLGSGPGRPADAAAAAKARTLVVPGRQDVVALAPRFTAPARLLLRFVDAAGTRADAPLEEAGEAVRPVCGFVLPDHLDGALEFFDAAGQSLGSLAPAPDGGGHVAWEDAPGTPSRAGRRPSDAIPDPALGAIADALVAWGVTDAQAGREEGALSALLRLIDSTLWTVDPFGHAGDEHLALLVGHPVVALRATLRLDLDDPLLPGDALTSPVAVRLGALAQWEDGLLGFFLRDDPTTVHAASPAAARLAREVGPGRGYLGPAGGVPAFHASFAEDLAPGESPRASIVHPFVSHDSTVRVWPGHPVDLTLLLVPHATVHATSGLLPRKELGVRRQWVADALARMAPAFRFGPALVDPRTIRMPVPTELGGTWTWNHRRDVTDWLDEPVVNATGDALIASAPAVAEEGWLTLHLGQEPPA